MNPATYKNNSTLYSFTKLAMNKNQNRAFSKDI